jgi:acetate---CoA ligase (ADP-forming)
MTIDAARAGLDAIFRPRTIAVVGASRDRTAIGHEILHNLIEYGFTGSIFPVNPRASTVHSLKCYPDPGSVPDPVDLAVIVVPRDVVPGAVDACGRAGVKGVVVITAGFKEVGGEGVRREAELLAMVRRYGMRMIGPNCMGVVNTHPDIRMNATFAKAMPISGEQPAKIGFISQSGALGEAILADAREMSLGTRRTSPATICSNTGRTIRRSPSSSCTSSPSGIRPSSRGSRAGSPAASRSSW